MSKLVKILIIINGFLIPIIIGIFFYQIFKPFSRKSPTEEEGIYVDERIEDARKNSVALQGLDFDGPERIYNSENCYLTINIATYEEAKKLGLAASISNDMSWSFYNIMNIVFLDRDYNVLGTLVNKKASITEMEEMNPRRDVKGIDETVKNIGYLIGFDDTNADGLLNSEDFHDLYISDLDGKNLLQVTRGIDVEDFNFEDMNSKIFIRYTERNDLKKEHKKVKFAL